MEEKLLAKARAAIIEEEEIEDEELEDEEFEDEEPLDAEAFSEEEIDEILDRAEAMFWIFSSQAS